MTDVAFLRKFHSIALVRLESSVHYPRQMCATRARRPRLAGALALCVLGALSLGAARKGGAPAACEAPPHFIAVDATTPAGEFGFLQVSLAKPQFTLDNLMCLARTLGRAHPDGDLTIFVFDARYAAGEFIPLSMELTPQIQRSNRQLRATYTRKASAREELLQLTPLGYGRAADFDTRIDLSADAAPTCRFSLDHRCLFAFDALDVPTGPAWLSFTGSVKLAGSVGASGEVGRVRLMSARGSSPAIVKRATAAAIENVTTWWFEPAPRERGVEVTYRFGLEVPPVRHTADLVIDVSNYLTITANLAK